jgi:hypothetical protein
MYAPTNSQGCDEKGIGWADGERRAGQARLGEWHGEEGKNIRPWIVSPLLGVESVNQEQIKQASKLVTDHAREPKDAFSDPVGWREAIDRVYI